MVTFIKYGNGCVTSEIVVVLIYSPVFSGESPYQLSVMNEGLLMVLVHP